jgi:hypothetical protein
MTKMSGENVFAPGLVRPVHIEAQNPLRFEQPDYIKALFTAATRATHLGVTILDSQTRVESLNAALASETRVTLDQHIGKTSHEIVGELAEQVQPTYEKVLCTGKPASVWLAGHVRDTPEFGHWLDYCFPIFDKSGRVQQLGVFVLNVTAEKESKEIVGALAFDSKFLSLDYSELLHSLDEAILGYHVGMRRSFQELSSPSTESARKADYFRSRLEQIDNEVSLIRELIFTVIARLPIPTC